MNGTTLVANASTIFTVTCPPVLSTAGSTNICSGNTSILSAYGAQSYTWSNGATGSINPVTPTLSTNYTVTGTNATGCVGSDTIFVNVASPPVASFTTTPGANGMHTLTSTSSGTLSSSTFFWYFGNGSPNYVATGSAGIVPPAQTYTSGTYTISLSIHNTNPFCVDSTSQIIIGCPIQANFSSVATASNAFNFFSTSTGTVSNSTYLWNFGDGTNSNGPNPSHTYSSTGVYTITLTVSNSSLCSSSFTKTMVISNCNVFSNFTHTILTNGVVNFSSSSSTISGSPKYYWNFGDGFYSLAASPTHTYMNAGTYLVKLKIIDTLSTCKDSLIQSLNVTGITCVANANFSIAPSFTTHYWTAIPSYPYNITSATWYWGDGTQSNTLYASHLYSVAANYSICLSVTVSCGSNSYYCHSYYLNKSSDQSSQIVSINVEAPPITNFILKRNLDDFSFLIYPNPNSGEFNILLDAATKEVNVLVYNSIGELIFSDKIADTTGRETVRLNNVPNGIYFVRLSSGLKTITQKIVISK
jgi:PKD repeat protein